MPKEEIERLEWKVGFKLFIRRVGLKNFDEYMQLFGNDRAKRQTAVERFIEEYPNQAN